MTWSLAAGCLVPLEVSGQRPPLFCVHAIGGTVAYYRPLARRLSHLRDVYGLQCHGVSPRHEPDRTIEAMAARYVDAILARCPEGPYEIAGYSMGGVISFEMARLLRARGRQVALLGVIDTEPPGTPQSPVTIGEALELISRAIELFPPFEGDPHAREDELLRRFIADAVARGRLPAAFRVQDLKPMVDTYAINGEAYRNYRAEPIDTTVSCLFTRRPDTGATTALARQWGCLTRRAVRVDVIEANHFALMHEEHAGQVAEVITEWITG